MIRTIKSSEIPPRPLHLEFMDSVQLPSGLSRVSFVAYSEEDNSYLVHDDHELYFIDQGGNRQQLGRRKNYLNRTLEGVIADIERSREPTKRRNMRYYERLSESDEEDGNWSRNKLLAVPQEVDSYIDEQIKLAREYFEQSDPFEQIEKAKITEDGKLVVIYKCHRVPDRLKRAFRQESNWEGFYQSDRWISKYRLSPEKTRSLRVFNSENGEEKHLPDKALRRRRIHDIEDLCIGPDRTVYAVTYKHELHEDDKHGSVQVLTPRWKHARYFGNRRQDKQAYGGLQCPIGIGFVGETIGIADSLRFGEGHRILLFTPQGDPLTCIELDDMEDVGRLGIFFTPNYIGVFAYTEEEIHGTYTARKFPQFWRKETHNYTSLQDFVILQIYDPFFQSKGIIKIEDDRYGAGIRPVSFHGPNLFITQSMKGTNYPNEVLEIQRYSLPRR